MPLYVAILESIRIAVYPMRDVNAFQFAHPRELAHCGGLGMVVDPSFIL